MVTTKWTAINQLRGSYQNSWCMDFVFHSYFAKARARARTIGDSRAVRGTGSLCLASVGELGSTKGCNLNSLTREPKPS